MNKKKLTRADLLMLCLIIVILGAALFMPSASGVRMWEDGTKIGDAIPVKAIFYVTLICLALVVCIWPSIRPRPTR